MKNQLSLNLIIFLCFVAFTLNLAAQSVTSLTLVNANSNADIGVLVDGDVIDLGIVGSALNVRANVSGTVGSVKFEYDESNIGFAGNSSTAVESAAPYALRGDQSGNYNSWTPSPGEHTLKATPYTEASAGGSAGTALTITFVVVETTSEPVDNYDLPAEPGTGAMTIAGEQKKWHKITLSFDGPFYKETDIEPNPFLDYRLNVRFSNGTNSYVVPGYFASDGNAAESGASSGNVWRVHFAPDAEGTWNWEASFRLGGTVAVSLDETEGIAVPPIDGQSGSFNVGASDKSGRDLRAKGRLEYVGMHHLRFAETGEYFLKGGPDAPENILAYEDFDGSFKSDGQADNKVKSWSPHEKDWNNGDPSWKNGKGTELIGAVNYLASEGLNAFSFLTMNINGDDKNVFPYVSYSNYQHMDCSKMDQWGIVFDHATNKGMYLHFKTQETENETLLDGGNVGTNRKLYYRELVARFSHNLALNWNLGEENNDQSDQQRKSMAQYFYDIDPYHHNVVLHTFPGGQDKIYTPLLGNKSKLTGASIQIVWNKVHSETDEWVRKSAGAGKKWVVANDEQGNAKIGVPNDGYGGTPNIHDIRKQTLWGNIMAGGAGVEYYFGYDLPHSDLTCEDFRSRDRSWDFVRYALEFFKNNELPFWQMSQKDNLTSRGWCLAEEGQVYVVYLSSGGTANLTINENGNYHVKWYDPRNGGSLQDGSVTSISGTGAKSLGTAPENASSDWVVLVTNANGINLAPIAIANADYSSGVDSVFVNFDAGASYDTDGSIVSYEWDFDDGAAETGIITSHHFTEAGTYEVKLKVTDNEGSFSTKTIVIEVIASSDLDCGDFVEMMSKDFPLNDFYLDDYTGEDLLAVQPGASPVTASTALAFPGESCTYDLTFHGVGESDGQSAFKIFVNDQEVGSYTLPFSTQGYEFGSAFNLSIPNLSIHNGDMIKVEGTTATDGEEWSRARWLKITFLPLGEAAGPDCDGADFVEEDGLLVAEIESIPAASGWAEESTQSGFSGTSYYRWNGGDRFNNPGSGKMEYKIKINTPGTYHFRWHSKIMHGSDATESNDTWMRIPDADDFFGSNGSTIKYPKGGMFVQSNTTVNGASGSGWMKVYSSGTTNWTWSCRTSDNDPHEIYAKFNNPGVYTVQISGRSNNHAIDRFVLFKTDEYSVSQATKLALDETSCLGSDGGDNEKPKDHELTVLYGSGSGTYTEGDVVMITAYEIEDKVFLEWTGSVEQISDVDASTTTFKMGAEDAFITANYEDVVYTYTLTVNNGSGSGAYERTEYVAVVANNPPAGKVFDQWTGDVRWLVDKTADSTTCFMPAENISVTATYRDDNVSADKHSGLSMLAYYPNPVGDILHVENLTGQGSIQLISMTGAVHKTWHFKQSKIIMDVADLPPGVYVMRIRGTKEQVNHRKVTIE